MSNDLANAPPGVQEAWLNGGVDESHSSSGPAENNNGIGVSSNGFTGLVVGYGSYGPTAGSITGSLLGDLVANSPSYNDQIRKLKAKKGH